MENQFLADQLINQFQFGNIKNGKAGQILKDHKNRIYCIQVSDSGLYLASGGQDGKFNSLGFKIINTLKDLQSIVYDSKEIEDIQRQKEKAMQFNHQKSQKTYKNNLLEQQQINSIDTSTKVLSEYNFNFHKNVLTMLNQSPIYRDSIWYWSKRWGCKDLVN